MPFYFPFTFELLHLNNLPGRAFESHNFSRAIFFSADWIVDTYMYHKTGDDNHFHLS